MARGIKVLSRTLLLLPKEDTASAMSVATGVSIPSTADVSLTYRVDDKVSSMTTGGITRSYSFDQFGRQSSWVDSTASTVVHTNHYDDSSDSPTFSIDSTGAWSRNITDLAGNVAVTSSGTSTGAGATVVYTVNASTLQMSDMHGDFVATMATDAGTNTLSSSCAFDEYGSTFQSAGLSVSGQYGWLGTKERSTELTGLMLMGVRVYNPATGRFLQVDPVAGGSSGPYLYPTDPILVLDLSGCSAMDYVVIFLDKFAGAAMIYGEDGCMPCLVVGISSAGIAAILTAKNRHYKEALLNFVSAVAGAMPASGATAIEAPLVAEKSLILARSSKKSAQKANRTHVRIIEEAGKAYALKPSGAKPKLKRNKQLAAHDEH